ncbi:MAG: hypothetical protein AAFN10_03575 [Bacteroidota bacterium]
MRRLYQKITPTFLRRWDHQLLIHHPWVWATQIHHLAYWLGISLVLLGLTAWGQMLTYSPCIQADADSIENTFDLIVLVEFLGLGIWLWTLTQNRWLESRLFLSMRQALKRFLLLSFGLLMWGLLPLFYAAFLYSAGRSLEVLLTEDFWPIQWFIVFILIPFWCLLFEVAAYLKRAQFLAVLLGRLGLTMLSIFIFSFSELIGLDQNWLTGWGFIIFVLAEIILLLVVGYRSANKTKRVGLQIIALAMLPIVMSLIQFFWFVGTLYEFFFEESPIGLNAFFGIYLGLMCATLLIWHLFLRKRIVDLQLKARD